tara:strand:+ start:5729 stop:5971 length:243 start_codon:yes stop_codon:yes gene_type:complete
MREAIQDALVIALAFALAFWAMVITPAKACTVDRIEGGRAVVEVDLGALPYMRGAVYFVDVPAAGMVEGQALNCGRTGTQ